MTIIYQSSIITSDFNTNPIKINFLLEKLEEVYISDILSKVEVRILENNSNFYIIGVSTKSWEYEIIPPTQRFSLGFSYQVIKNNTDYREFSLNELSFSNNENLGIITLDDGTQIETFGEGINAFSISVKYERGKYFQ